MHLCSCLNGLIAVIRVTTVVTICCLHWLRRALLCYTSVRPPPAREGVRVCMCICALPGGVIRAALHGACVRACYGCSLSVIVPRTRVATRTKNPSDGSLLLSRWKAALRPLPPHHWRRLCRFKVRLFLQENICDTLCCKHRTSSGGCCSLAAQVRS